LLAEGLTPYKPIVNEMVTSLDMAGCSLTLCWLDDELTALLDAPCASAAYTNI
jgi:dihydroxyacetone kinase